jgi:hypothetical protein
MGSKSLSSESSTIASRYFDPFAAKIVHSTRDFPLKSFMFFPGSLLLPARAGITARIVLLDIIFYPQVGGHVGGLHRRPPGPGWPTPGHHTFWHHRHIQVSMGVPSSCTSCSQRWPNSLHHRRARRSQYFSPPSRHQKPYQSTSRKRGYLTAAPGTRRQPRGALDFPALPACRFM